MERYQKIFSIIVIVAIIGVGALVYWSQGSQSAESIKVYSGAGLRKPMDEIGMVFENEYGIQVNYIYAGSNTLLSQIELNKEGDAYMPGATYYINTADNKGFIGKKKFVAYHTPVIAVPKGNPANIQGLNDLTEPGVDVVWGDPGACAIGRLGEKILKKNEILDEVENNIISRAATVNELVVNITMEQADAGVIWKANLYGVENETDYVMIEEEKNIIKKVPIGTLTFSEKKDAARKFVEFVGDKGKGIFAEYGFIKYEN